MKWYGGVLVSQTGASSSHSAFVGLETRLFSFGVFWSGLLVGVPEDWFKPATLFCPRFFPLVLGVRARCLYSSYEMT